jgi:hypothetical protein
MFGNWLNGVEKQTKAWIRVGVCALIWAIWNCRNDLVFNKKGTAHFLQVIRMAIHWTRDWSYLLPEAQRAPMVTGCSRLETVARDIFNLGDWRLSKRIQDAYACYFTFIPLADICVPSEWSMICKLLKLWILQ